VGEAALNGTRKGSLGFRIAIEIAHLRP
jgi:hypothetical protein